LEVLIQPLAEGDAQARARALIARGVSTGLDCRSKRLDSAGKCGIGEVGWLGARRELAVGPKPEDVAAVGAPERFLAACKRADLGAVSECAARAASTNAASIPAFPDLGGARVRTREVLLLGTARRVFAAGTRNGEGNEENTQGNASKEHGPPRLRPMCHAGTGRHYGDSRAFTHVDDGPLRSDRARRSINGSFSLNVGRGTG
jgi:hypothetical protein